MAPRAGQGQHPQPPTMASMAQDAPLLVLPNELQLAIIEHLRQPQDILHLGATCQALHAIATSDDVWRARVEALVHRHARTHTFASSTSLSWNAGAQVYARLVDCLLGSGSKYLGWWASTQPYRGRLVRVSIHLRHDTGSLAIVAEEAHCINAFETEPGKNEKRPKRWKPAAAQWHNPAGLSYRLPINHLSPHAGLSVDVLYPVLQFIPIFCLTPERGFTLISTDDGSPKPSLPISVPLDLAFRRELEDTSGTSEHPPSRYSTEVGPSFPGHDAVSAGLLRSVTAWDSAGNDTSNQRETSSNTVYLQGDMLTAPAFTLKARRAQPVGDEVASSTANSTNVRQPVHAGNNMDFIYQSREETPLPVAQPPILLANPGGNQLFRAFLEGIGAVLPQQMRDALFDEPDERDLQEYFYPITRCPLPDDRIIPRPLSKPVLAASLEGLWVGCYSTHGFEFGIINVRNAWMPTEPSNDGSSIIEQFYHDQRLQEGNADLSVNRESLAPNLAGSTRVLRTIIELVKVTGDVNVPAGQVSWCAVLPRPFDQDYSTTSSNASDEIMEEIEDLDISDIESIELPTLKRSDWQEWSDAPPHTAEQHYGLRNPPRWDEGSFEAAGRIAFTGFIDTRFIDAVATFIREDTGEVDEICITWHEMGKVSCFRRCHLD